MTRQKFYETCLLRTFQTAWNDPDNPLFGQISKLDSIEGLTFKEILMKLQLLGVDNIPTKENFKEWGVGYLCQLLGFVNSEDDCEFTKQFFSFLRTNKGLYKKPEDRKHFGDVCYYAFMENCCKNRDFSHGLGTFMIFTFKGEKWFDDFLKVAYNLALLDMDGMDEYQRIKYGSTLSERIAEIMENTKTVDSYDYTEDN